MAPGDVAAEATYAGITVDLCLACGFETPLGWTINGDRRIGLRRVVAAVKLDCDGAVFVCVESLDEWIPSDSEFTVLL